MIINKLEYTQEKKYLQQISSQCLAKLDVTRSMKSHVFLFRQHQILGMDSKSLNPPSSDSGNYAACNYSMMFICETVESQCASISLHKHDYKPKIIGSGEERGREKAQHKTERGKGELHERSISTLQFLLFNCSQCSSYSQQSENKPKLADSI